MKSDHQVGTRVTIGGQSGVVTEVLADRNEYRVRLDSGQGVRTSERYVLAEREPEPRAETGGPRAEEKSKGTRPPQDKGVRGPRER